MARARFRLSALQVKGLKVPGRYADGGGLYLVIDATSRRWVFRWAVAGRTRDMGLGGARDISLARARELAGEARDLVLRGQDPITARRLARSVPTFAEAAEAYVAAQAPRFRNAKHLAQWRTTLLVQAAAIGGLPVDQVDTDAVLKVLRPLWSATPETASRLRGRIERVLDAAKAAEHRTGENPARWRGHLDHLLPRQAAMSRGHHAAMTWQEAPAFMERLRARESVSARALEWTILTVARTGETIGARWEEIAGDLWTVPAARMKRGREHRVPLPARCMEIAAEMRELGSPWVFPGGIPGEPLSNMAMLELLKGMVDDCTVHGFRSTFRDWAGDETGFPSDVIEAALAHQTGSKTERAYRRQDALDKRRRLLDAWAGLLAARPSARVVNIR